MSVGTNGLPLLRLMVSAVLAAAATGTWADGAQSRDGGFLPVQHTANSNLSVRHGEDEHHRRHYVPVTDIKVTPAEVSLKVGARTHLTASVLPDNASNKTVFWLSDDRSIARVGEHGEVRAVSPGAVLIRAITKDGKHTDFSTVTVTDKSSGADPVAVTGVTLTPNATVKVGATTTLTATVSPANASNKAVIWTTSDTTIAMVSDAGVVTGVAKGNATVTVTTTDGNRSATSAVTVTADAPATIPVTGVTLTPTATVKIGATTGLTATVQPADATNMAVTWSTSDAMIATVSATGNVTAVAAGTAIITATTADGAFTTSCTVTVPAAAASVGIHVSGSEVDERDGKPFLMRGINVADAWYADKTTGSLTDIAKTGANTVRIVLASGDRWTKTSEATVSSLIAQAKANKLIAILEVHDTTGYGEQAGAITLAQAVDYWKSIKGALVGQEDYVIIDIGNEPFGNGQPASAWTDGHIAAIKSLRDAGFNHAIMVDAANWGQDWENIMRDNAPSVLAADPQKNVIFSVHMYQVYDKAATIDSYMSTFKKNNLALVVGEFAADHQGANVDEATIMADAKQYGYGYLGWSWSGNGTGLESLDIAQNFNAGTLTPWGETLINGANGIKATSTLASIYGGGSVVATVRVMPLGDSITGSPGCWRKNVWTTLADNTKVDMVGVRNNESECGTGWDADNAAFGGMRVTNGGSQIGLAGAARTDTVTVAPNVTPVPGNLEVWLEHTRPDLVMMNLGTNDIWSGVPAATILSGYDKLLAQMRASNSKMHVIVAKIGKFDPRDSSGAKTCANCATDAAAFNTALDAWAQCATTADSPITVIDIASNWNPATMTDDGVHPNALGTTTMASIWQPVLEAALTGINTAGPGPAPTCSTAAPATDAADGTASSAGGVATTLLSSFRTGAGALQVYKTDGNADATLATVSTDRPSSYATEGNTAAKVVLATNADAMVGTTPSVGDWSKAHYLKVDMAATGGIYWTQLVTKSGSGWNWCTLGQSASIAANTSSTVSFDLTAQTCYGSTKTIADYVSNDVKQYYLLVQATSGTYYIDNVRLE